jgi:carboxymethylenebutenolidase
MCYSPKDMPPDPPGGARPATGEDLVLTSADGTRFAAFAARASFPEQPQAAVLIYPDVRGLHNFYKELALRFAGQGIHAVALDYFGRTAGLTSRDDSFEFMPHVQQIEFPSFLADVRASLDYIRTMTPVPQGVFTLGFCMGGSLSLLTATQPDLDLAGAIAFYSGFSRKFAGFDRTTLDAAVDIAYPVLGLYGGTDQGIPMSAIDELDRNLDTAGVTHELLVYPDAPHSFFDRKATEFAADSADAWTRVLTFIQNETKARAQA